MENQLLDWWFASQQLTAFTILDHGRLNPSDGPDILSATVEIGNTVYCGDVEFDWNFNGWFRHGHFQSAQFRNCLLHIYRVGQVVPYSGNQPRFTYNTHDHAVVQNQRFLSGFLERKYQFMDSFSFLRTLDAYFWLLFARSLGFYHNREEMTYFALRCLEMPIFTETDIRRLLAENGIHGNTKQVRPNNRLLHRAEQWLAFWNHRVHLSTELFALIQERLPLKQLLSKSLNLFNTQIHAQFKLSRNRIQLFLLNGLLPLCLYKTPTDNYGFISYLNQLLVDLSQQKEIRQVHRNQSIF